MKILLTAVNSKYIHSNLAVYSLKAYHDAHSDRKDTVELAEYTINQLQEEIIKDIYKKQPDVLAFSCYIWNIEMIHRMICELKKILPDTDIWLGGPEVSYDAKEVLKNHPQIKGVMIGEGEQTFCELAACYENFYGIAKSTADLFSQSDGRNCGNAVPRTDEYGRTAFCISGYACL